MSVVVTAYAEHPRLALTPTIEAVTDVTIQVVAQTGTDPEHDTFPFLVQCGDCDRLESVFERDQTIERFRRIGDGEAGRLYHISHTPDAKLLTPKTVEVGGIVIDARSENAGWLMTLLLPHRKALHALWEYAREQDIQFDLVELVEEGTTTMAKSYGLTDCQRETLGVAFEMGYFTQPRTASLEAIAEALDVSPSAVSGRLRRGIDQLLSQTLFVEEGHDWTPSGREPNKHLK